MTVKINDLSVVATAKGRQAKFKVEFDTSYPTGGEPITPAVLGLTQITNFDVAGAEVGYLFDYDYSNEKLKVLSGAGGAHSHSFGGLNFTGSFFNTMNARVIHDASAATNGTQLFGCVKDGKIEEAVFCSDTDNGLTAEYEITDGGQQVTTFVIHKPIASEDVQVTHNGAPAGPQLYLRPIDGNKAKLVSVSPTNAHGTFQINNGGDTIPVWDDDAAAQDSIPVYCDDDATDGERLVITGPVAMNYYVETDAGRWIQFTDVANAAAVGTAVTFLEAAGNAWERLESNLAGAATIQNLNDSSQAWTDVTDEAIFPIYFDEDANDQERFLIKTAAGVNMVVPFVDLNSPRETPRLKDLTFSATADVDGVLVYFDDDAANPDERMLFVSPTTTEGLDNMNVSLAYYGSISNGTIAGNTAASSGGGAGAAEVANTTNLYAAGLTSVECVVDGL